METNLKRGDKIGYDTTPSNMGKGVGYYVGVYKIGNLKMHQVEHSLNGDRIYLIPIDSKIDKV